MGAYLALRDKRLEGGVPARSGLYIVNTDEGVSLSSAFSSINAAARAAGGTLNAIFILCHGYAGENVNAGMSADAGGMGLQIGREDMLHSNVSLWAAIEGAANNIVIYACAASDTEPGNEGTTSDGRYLMGALAIHTNANVFAADRIQWYNTYNNLTNGRYDFGAWEGQLLKFPPSGAPPTIVAGAPVEFSDVMGGTAP